ncbi:MAG: MBL fold metallo-hydrolase [Dehalococcoidales bacterium]|nr:MBL fold metallo-hydrolase [Dehalococcoidales bacterium]
MAIEKPVGIRLGTANAYLLPAQKGYVLIDAGNAGQQGKLFDLLERHGVSPREVFLVVVTHVHYDHVGGLRAIVERSCARVLVHEAEADLLRHGKASPAAGATFYGKVIRAVGSLVAVGRLGFQPCRPDLVVAGDTPLRVLGLDGTVLHTPGHSAGSLSVLLDNGDAFVGDLCMNAFPLGRGPIFPPFADSAEALYASWARLLDAGARRIFPGHGKPFAAEVLRKRVKQTPMRG